MAHTAQEANEMDSSVKLQKSQDSQFLPQGYSRDEQFLKKEKLSGGTACWMFGEHQGCSFLELGGTSTFKSPLLLPSNNPNKLTGSLS